jgi:hypothetical protein
VPVQDRGIGTVTGSHLDGVRLDPVPAIPTPHNNPRTRRRSAPEGRGRAGLGFHSVSLEEERERANGFAGGAVDLRTESYSMSLNIR